MDVKQTIKTLLPDPLIRCLHFCRKLVATWRWQLRDGCRRIRAREKHRLSAGKVSIVIPTLSRGKQADHLDKLKTLLVRHLPRQTYRDYEAIVYCDGPNPDVEAMAAELHDDRIRVLATETTLGKWGHPQTRLGIMAATGDYFVRMNDDNVPWPKYLETLAGGFGPGVGLVYGRIIYRGDARRAHARALTRSFVLPSDLWGTLEHLNFDCMNCMVRMDVAKAHVTDWSDSYDADWFFIEALLRDDVRSVFRDALIGEKY